MKYLLFLALMMGLSSCGQSHNSNSNDLALYTKADFDRSTPGGERFYKAYEILRVKCMNCHSSQRHAHWADFIKVEDWTVSESGQTLVVPGKPLDSSIIYRLKIWGSVGGMPEGPEQITSEEYDTLKEWIDNIGI